MSQRILKGFMILSLLAASTAMANADGMASVPVDIKMSAEPITAKVGDTVKLNVAVTMLRAMPGLTFALKVDSCAKVASGTQTQDLGDAKAGATYRFDLTLQMVTQAPCPVIASVMTKQEGGSRFGSVQGIEINPRAPMDGK